MRVLIIGGLGILGRSVANDVVRRGHGLTIVHRGNSGQPFPSTVRQIVGERKDLPELLRKTHVDVMLDMVCATEFDARTLLRTCKACPCRCVVLSSADVYRAFDVLSGYDCGALEPTPLVESSNLRTTRYPYRRSGNLLDRYYDKLIVETVLSQSDAVNPTILRIPPVFGPGLNVPFRGIAMQMLRGERIIAVNCKALAWKSSWSYIDNVVKAITDISTDERGLEGTYNIADKRSVSYHNWIQQYAIMTGWHGTLIQAAAGDMSSDLELPPNVEQNWDLDSQKLRNDFQFRDVVSWPEAAKIGLQSVNGVRADSCGILSA
jgi:nucleoside-diphosphate-sugar epimerase